MFLQISACWLSKEVHVSQQVHAIVLSTPPAAPSFMSAIYSHTIRNAMDRNYFPSFYFLLISRHKGPLSLTWFSCNLRMCKKNYIDYKMWDEITYPCPNINGCTVEVCEWITNFIHTLLILARTKVKPCLSYEYIVYHTTQRERVSLVTGTRTRNIVCVVQAIHHPDNLLVCKIRFIKVQIVTL